MGRRLRGLVAVVAVGLAPATAAAQQNLFNVPSVQPTTAGGLFFQQQFNFNTIIQSNTTLSYGLGNGAEVGLNLFDVPLYNPYLGSGALSRAAQEPDLLVNALKVFDLTEQFRVGVGTQIGQNAPVLASSVRLVDFTYVNTAYKLPAERGELYLGAYFADRGFRGPGDGFGLLVGADIPVVEKKFHLVADWVTGRNDIGVAVVGGVIYLPKGWQLSLGGQLPSPRSGNRYGGVVELTFVPGGDN